MKLRIGKIHLKNFKTFKEMTFHPNDDFNIIIGENSAGKSSLFEAIHLWEKCYKTFILASRKGFYKVKKSTNRYVNYQELDFLRITQDDDLFYDSKLPGLRKCAEITLTLKNDDTEWNLGFKITCPTSIENAFYRVQPIDDTAFNKFAEDFCKNGKYLDEAIFIYQTKPISGVHQYEPYYNEAQIKKRIQKSSSHEVLRNKIIAKRRSIIQLEENISRILEKEVKFELPAINRKDKDEYIDLKVSVDGSKAYDLHLQGSGFLQIIEILSTIEFIQAPLKLLLVDEPDSHIHVKLQQNLLNFLRDIDHNQFFVISHNDQFVSNANEGELFFLNEEAKTQKQLLPIAKDSFDIIKHSLGGVIVALEDLNKSKNIVFVEGDDDATYLKSLYKQISAHSILNLKNNFDTLSFFPLRGKDQIIKKIEYNKRTLSSLFKNKKFHVIYDKDYSTQTIDEHLQNGLRKHCSPYSHQGYCIESVLFSDLFILTNFLKSIILNEHKDKIDQQAIKFILDEMYNQLKDATTELNTEFEGKFLSQKKNRPEFESHTFNDFLRGIEEHGNIRYELFMSKPMIVKFIHDVENIIETQLFIRDSNEPSHVSSEFFNLYCQNLDTEANLYPSFKEAFKQLNII